MRKAVYIAAVLSLAYVLSYVGQPADEAPFATPSASNTEQVLQAYENRESNVQVRGQGTVIKVLPDDTQGSRHQKFLLRLAGGHTLLVAHNIDLAPRIEQLREGDSVGFHGEYEWNNKGGVIHWTHHDPNNRHTGGWLTHNGKTYQ
ncbi:MAG: DUF3465 domain-containing protein [Halopseudomonas sabulinigri]